MNERTTAPRAGAVDRASRTPLAVAVLAVMLGLMGCQTGYVAATPAPYSSYAYGDPYSYYDNPYGTYDIYGYYSPYELSPRYRERVLRYIEPTPYALPTYRSPYYYGRCGWACY